MRPRPYIFMLHLTSQGHGRRQTQVDCALASARFTLSLRSRPCTICTWRRCKPLWPCCARFPGLCVTIRSKKVQQRLTTANMLIAHVVARVGAAAVADAWPMASTSTPSSSSKKLVAQRGAVVREEAEKALHEKSCHNCPTGKRQTLARALARALSIRSG